MNEYIEREAVRNELYDADAITMSGVAILNTFPAADVVEVVRCKDCRHGKLVDTSLPGFRYYRPECIMCECEEVVGDEPMVYFPTHFCSYGDRKDVDNG